ncbi:MAG: hypothetical protein LBL24_02635 [Bacteroidales bacterium]|nr:hypothetical protein [Bacteroidales bacterium]
MVSLTGNAHGMRKLAYPNLSVATQPDRSARCTDVGSSARPDRVVRPVRVKTANTPTIHFVCALPVRAFISIEINAENIRQSP